MTRHTHSESRAAVLRALGPEPLTSAEIAQRTGFSEETVRRALNGLLEQGRVERSVIAGDGSRWRYGWQLVKGE